MTPILTITHRADLDGWCSQAIARRTLGESSRYLGWDYGDPVPDLSPYDRVYVIDISLPRDVMVAHAEKLVWLDHHKSVLDTYPSYLAGTRIDGIAACRLAWQWFNGDRNATKADYLDHRVSEPYAVQLLGEFDVWLKTNPDTDPFQYGMQATKEPDWPCLLNSDEGRPADALIAGTIAKGRAVLDYLDVTNAKLVTERGFDVDFEGRHLLALNTSIKGSMQFAAAVKPEHDGCLAFSWNGKAWGFSLYGVDHKRDLDLSTIAVKHGGGGHKQACGGTFQQLPKELGGT